MKQKFIFEPRWFSVLIFFICGVCIGSFFLFIWLFNGGQFYGIQKIHPRNSKYKFINPLLAIENGQGSDFFTNEILRNKLQSIIDKKLKNNSIQEASVYFRDLDPGRWVGINESFKFSPGKILKVPIMMAYYKQAETNPEVLKKILIYNENPALAGTENQTALEDKKSYSVDELLNDMVINDNDAATDTLYDNINLNYLNEVFNDLGIDYQEDKNTDDYLSVRLYSLFFRVLYNATYLNRDYSEKALNILSQTPNTDGIATGLPNDIVFSNKYRTRKLQNSTQEGHDCGIIYYPNHPYLLCVMGIGKSGLAIDEFFKELSQVIFKDMSERYKN